jgi:hypothetical protein
MASGSFFTQSSGSFFIQSSEAALRHVKMLADGLKKVALAGLVGGAGCGVMAILLGRFLVNPSTANDVPGPHEMTGLTFVATFMALALLVFSGLYLLASWGLSQQKSWARYTASATFMVKILLCVWLGRGSLVTMLLFLMVSGLDFYGLWVLLAKETGQLFTSPQSVPAKPANLVT